MSKGEIWLVQLPTSNGREQAGMRPALVVSTKAPLPITIPLTSQLKALNLPYTNRIDASEKNGLEVDSVALVLQLRALDKHRFVRKMGTLEPTKLRGVMTSIRSLFGM